MLVSTKMEGYKLSSLSDDNSNPEDVLEKMLKEAEELAMKMSRKSTDSNASSRAGSVVSTDCANSNDHVLATTMANDDDDDHDDGDGDVNNKVQGGNMFSGSLDDHLEEDGNAVLEEILKKSETLLDKMKSRTSGGVGIGTPTIKSNSNIGAVPQSSSFGRAPSPSVVCPPKTSPPAPSSVYLLDPSNCQDDVSSVGSASLRSPAPSPAAVSRVPYFPMTPGGSPIREDEPLLVSVIQPFVHATTVAEESSRNNKDDAIIRYDRNYSRGAPTPPTDSLQEKTTPAKVHSTTTPSRPTPQHLGFAPTSGGADNTLVSPHRNVSSPLPAVSGRGTELSSTVSKEARWEKVDLAKEGDDDYVPLVDYSNFPKSPPVVASSGRGNNSSSPSSFLGGGRAVVGSVTTTAATPRVAAYRAYERKRRKRQRQIKAVAFLVTCVLAGIYYYCYSSSSSGGVANEIVMTSNGRVGESSMIRQEEEVASTAVVFDEGDSEVKLNGDARWGGLANYSAAPVEAGSCINNHDDNGDGECMMAQDRLENELLVNDNDEGDKFGGVQVEEVLVSEKIDGLDSLEKDDPIDDNILKEKLVTAKHDDKTTDETSFGMPLSPPDEYSSRRIETFHSDQAQLERRCKNPIQRIFNRNCRILARYRKRRPEKAHVLNLLSGAYN